MRRSALPVLLFTAIVASSTILLGWQDTAARVLLASVVDLRGRTMVDFAADDFVVSEGTVEREILDVHVADYPVAVLLDDQSPAGLWPAIQAAAVRFVTRIGERPVLVATLSNNGQLISPFDAERGDTVARIRAYTPSRDTEVTALSSVASASRQLQQTESPFSAIVVVAAREIDANDPVRGDLLPVIVDSGANVHVVEVRPGGMNRLDTLTTDLLRVIADQTHGQYTPIYSPASFSIALDRLADRLAAELMIQYLVPPGQRTSDVKVGVRRPGALVLGLGVSR